MDNNVFVERPAFSCPPRAAKLRQVLRDDVDQSHSKEGIIKFRYYQRYSVGLPPLSTFPVEFQNLYKDAAIDLDMKDDLERSDVINWCRSVKPLYPLRTTGDGNCLLHAVSQYMWGVEDTEMFLRRILYVNLSTDPGGKFYRRWTAHQKTTSELHRFDVRMNTEEWGTVIKATEDATGSGGQGLPYSTLESIHLYALANILKRPIIVLADQLARNVYGQSLQESHIGGIYLPLELLPAECYKNPILIGYNMNHFAPLLSEEDMVASQVPDLEQVVPLVTKDMNSLLIRYTLPEEERNCMKLLQDYLIVEEVVHSGGDGIFPVPSAKIDHKPLPEDLNVMLAHRLDCERKFRRLLDNEVGYVPADDVRRFEPQVRPFDFRVAEGQANVPLNIPEKTEIRTGHNAHVLTGVKTNVMPQPARVGPNEQHLKCVTIGCQMYGNPEMARMCSHCFNDFTVQYARQEQAAKRVQQPVDQNVAGANWRVPQAQAGAYGGGIEDLSIMLDEDCRAGCGFKCSKETYPYCHECVQKQSPVAMSPNRNQRPANSMLPDKCQTVNCEYRCSKATYPYCHECFEKQKAIARKAPTAPPPSIPDYTAMRPNVPLPPRNKGTPNLQLHIVSNDETSVVQVPNVYPRQDLGPVHNQAPVLPGQVGETARKCQTTNCPNKAIKGNNGLCDECYNESMLGTRNNAAISPTTAEIFEETVRILDKIPSICATENCMERALNNSTHCMRCTSATGYGPSTPSSAHDDMQLNIHPAAAANEKILNSDPGPGIRSLIGGGNSLARSISQPQQHDENPGAVVTATATRLQAEEQARYQDVPHRKYICSTPGCEGIRIDNANGLCCSCMRRNEKAQQDESTIVSCTPIVLSEKEMKEINPVVVSSRQKVKCASTICDKMIYPPKKLCDECNSILERSKAEMSKKTNELTVSTSSKKCIAKGCQFFGSRDFDGYCSSCHQGRANLRHTAPLVSKSSSQERQYHTAPLIARPEAATFNTTSRTPPAKSASPQLNPKSGPASRYGRSGKLCIEVNCQRYGDPSQMDRCSQHYQQSQARFPPPGSHGNINPIIEDVPGRSVVRNNNLSGGVSVGAVGTVRNQPSQAVDPYYAAMSKVEMSRKSTDLCKNYSVNGCRNFGSVNKRGYCNACFPLVQRNGGTSGLGKEILSGQNQFG